MCTRCKKSKNESEFYNKPNTKHTIKPHPWCKECRRDSTNQWIANHKEQHNNTTLLWHHNNPRKTWVIHTIDHHLRNGVNINDKDAYRIFLMELAERTEYCTLCETKLYWGFKGDGKIHSNSPSLDRKDNRSDLTPENSQITCTRCNVTKGDRSMEEFVSYCQDIALKFGDVMHS